MGDGATGPGSLASDYARWNAEKNKPKPKPPKQTNSSRATKPKPFKKAISKAVDELFDDDDDNVPVTIWYRGRMKAGGSFPPDTPVGSFRHILELPSKWDFSWEVRRIGDQEPVSIFHQAPPGLESLELEVHESTWVPPKSGYRSDVEKYQQRAQDAKRHRHELAHPPVIKSIQQQQQEALEGSRLLQFLDAAKRGDLSTLQQLRSKVAKFQKAGGIDLSYTGLWAEECPRQDLVSKTAVQLATGRGCVDAVEWLLSCNARMPQDILFDAILGFTFNQARALTVLRFVLRAGANVLHRDEATGDHPLHACLGYGNHALKAVPLLLEHKADPNAVDAAGATALTVAIGRGDRSLCETLLSAKCMVDASAFLAALESTDTQLQQTVVPVKCALLSAVNVDGSSVLHLAARKKQKAVAAEVMSLTPQGDKRSSVIDARDQNGATPLMIAAKYGSTSITHALIKAGADVHAVDHQGNTPLHYTYWEDPVTGQVAHNTKIYDSLCRNAGANPNAVNAQGEKPKTGADAAEDFEKDMRAAAMYSEAGTAFKQFFG